jgi:hypothetical protein
MPAALRVGNSPSCPSERSVLNRLDTEGESVVGSTRIPAALREALRIAVELGMDTSVNDATVQALRDRVAVFAQRLAFDRHFERYPETRPSLAELAQAAADLTDHPLAGEPGLIRQAANEVVKVKPDATSDDVLLWASALRSRQATA